MKVKEYLELREETIAAHAKGKPLTSEGKEVVDPIPMAPPPGYRKQPSMFDLMRDLVRQERVKAALEAEGLEDPDEADDFEVGDDYDPSSPYEYNFDHVGDPAVLSRLRGEIDRRERELRGEKAATSSSDAPSGGGAGRGADPEPGPASTSGPGKGSGPGGAASAAKGGG